MSDGGWEDVASPEDLPDGRPRRVTVGGEPVLLVRAGEEVLAVGNRCTHQGAALDRGVVRIAGSQRTVTCPAHGSMFRLDDGRVMRPPAASPIPVYEVRLEGGRVFLRAPSAGG